MNDNQQFRAVLWDIDGTLLLSGSTHFRALRHAVGTEGKHVPDDFHHEIVGRAARVVYHTARERFGLSMSFDHFRRLKYGYYTETRPRDRGAAGALEAWRTFAEHGLLQAVVSNSDRIVVNANIRVLGLEEPGFISVSINDVLNGKPHPTLSSGRGTAWGRDASVHRDRGQPDRCSGGPCRRYPHHRVAGGSGARVPAGNPAHRRPWVGDRKSSQSIGQQLNKTTGPAGAGAIAHR